MKNRLSPQPGWAMITSGEKPEARKARAARKAASPRMVLVSKSLTQGWISGVVPRLAW